MTEIYNEEGKELVNTTDADKYLTEKFSKRKLMKVEKLGEDALKFVYDCIMKDWTYYQIAKQLSETYEKKVTQNDVIAVVRGDAVLRAKYEDNEEFRIRKRADLVTDIDKVSADRVAEIERNLSELLDDIKETASPKHKLELMKIHAKLSKVQADISKNRTRMAGKSKESPSIMIDQSQKSVNINNYSENNPTVNKLAKQLAQANFKSNLKDTEEDDSDEDGVIDAEAKHIKEENTEEDIQKDNIQEV